MAPTPKRHAHEQCDDDTDNQQDENRHRNRDSFFYAYEIQAVMVACLLAAWAGKPASSCCFPSLHWVE